jgi:hypothetical protein
MLTNLHSERGRHVLGLYLQALLLLKLTLEKADPLLAIGTLLASRVALCAEPLHGLEQLVPLLL